MARLLLPFTKGVTPTLWGVARDREAVRLHAEGVEALAAALGELHGAYGLSSPRLYQRGRHFISASHDSAVDLKLTIQPVERVVIGDDELRTREVDGGPEINAGRSRGRLSGASA